MIGNQQRLTKKRLPFSVVEWRQQIRLRVIDQIDHRFQVSLECGNGLVPYLGIRWGITIRPVTIGERG